MLRHKYIDRVCCVVLALTLLISTLFVRAAAKGVITEDRTMGYESRLFDQSRIHTIDIVMNDWDAFLDTCTSEVYAACHLVIDGESYKNVAIRGKGNTSLSSVATYGNDRYSFKVEFDQYQNGHSYHGLDKMSLNNLIQDNTYMKDYFAYTLMNKMGVAAPLCSFVRINVNGEYWGLYLAVEGVEDAFLQRNYGKDHGELYKPDSLSFGGGRGNGEDFDMGEFDFSFGGEDQGEGRPEMPSGMGGDDSFGGSSGGSSGDSAGGPAATAEPTATATPEVTATPAPTATPAAPAADASNGGSAGVPADASSGEQADASSGAPADGSSGMPADASAGDSVGAAATANVEVTATPAPSAMPSGDASNGAPAGMPADASSGAPADGSSGAPADGSSGMPAMPDATVAASEVPAATVLPTELPAMPEGAPAEFDPSQMQGGFEMPTDFELPEGFEMPGGGFGGFGSSTDVKLQYTDDNPSSYSNIFNNAKTDITAADQARLIASIKALNEGDTSVVDVDAVIRYMAVHNFLCNDDSYTGMMVHNYYLYEENGVLAMIPWDYNLGYGGFTGGNATSTVNTSIDSLVSMGGTGDRPMADWIMTNEVYNQQYHEMYQLFIDEVFNSGWFEAEIDRVTEMIAPYVETDPTAFCTYEEFQTASQTLKSFCLKRAESVQHQLAGDNVRVDASELNISIMGTMNGMGGGMQPGGFGEGESFDRGERDKRRDEMGDTTAPAEEKAAPEATRPMEDHASAPGFGGMFGGSNSTKTSAEDIMEWLLICVGLLAVALLVAKGFKSHR